MAASQFLESRACLMLRGLQGDNGTNPCMASRAVDY